MMQTLVRRMRQIGLQRIYFGSDAPPKGTWYQFRRDVPLTRKEFESVAANAAQWTHCREQGYL